MSWPRPGPGRFCAAIEFAAWRSFLTRKEMRRIRKIEKVLRGAYRGRHESAAAYKHEYTTIRNRAVKRAAARRAA